MFMIPICCYPETHFRFGKISPSLLFQKSPEILFDIPARLEPKEPLFLFLLINHINEYPITLKEIEIGQHQKDWKLPPLLFSNLQQYQIEHTNSNRCSAYIIPLSTTQYKSGWLTLLPLLRYQERGKERELMVDNFLTASHLPLRTFIAKESLPESQRVLYGDMHIHSLHTQSHVEFGAPPEIVVKAAEMVGLSVVAITDHSYDLECKPENYLERDPNITNWEKQQAFSSKEIVVFMGEEVSTLREKGGVVHMGAIGHKSFIYGSRDGARKGYAKQKKYELSLQKAAQKITADGGITFAAHPGEFPSFLNRAIFKRDRWHERDLSENITAFQAINCGFDSSWYNARKIWVTALLKGKKIPLIAGNDAHGDFNRYRAIGFPFLYIKEDTSRYFGKGRVGFYQTEMDKKSVLEAIKRGRSFITTGPFLDLQKDGLSLIGEDMLSLNEVTAVAHSTPEFGLLKKIRVIMGVLGEREERIITIPCAENLLEYSHTVQVPPIKGKGYIRLEVESFCGEAGIETMAATSPLYISG